MAENAITIFNLTKRYGDLVAINELSIMVESGELFGLIGPDGAGKTTLMQVICGLRDYDSGNCTVSGYDCRYELTAIRKIIGYMPQRFSLYPDLTVAENLRFFADLFQVTRDERTKRQERLLTFNRLALFEQRRASDLSGGMKQKLALSCTLIHRPDILILDEPTTGVDPVSRREFWEILHELRTEGVTIFVSTPYMDEAQKCDRIAFMYLGRIMVIDRPDLIVTYFKKTLYELNSQDLYSTYNAMNDLNSVESRQLFGDRIHFTSSSLNMVKQELDEKAIPYTSIQQIEPTMEDVFIELMQQNQE